MSIMRVKTWQVQLLGVLLLLFLFLFIIPSFAHRIPKTIQENLSQHYQQQGYTWVKVEAEGRNVTLSGNAPNYEDANAVHQIAQHYAPLITIADKMTPRIIQPYSMNFNWNGQLLSLDGYIENQQGKQELLAVAHHLLNKKQIKTDLKLGSGTPQQWNKVLKKSVESLLKLQRGRIEIMNHAIYVMGQTPYSEQRSIIKQQFDKFQQYQTTFHIIAADESDKICQAQFKKLLGGSSIKFAENSTMLSKVSYPLLTKLANTIALCPNANINVIGYTDNVGNDKDNIELSLLRAKTVINWLFQQGISHRQLTADGKGRNNPIADNKTQAGRAANRRIEFIIEK